MASFIRVVVTIGLLLGSASTRAAVGESPPTDRVLRVGTSGDYPPFSLDGQGFDIDVAERFAADHGLEVEWVPFRWPELADSVAADRFDVAMSGVTWRPDRAVVGYMTRAVAAGGPCVVGSASPRRVAVNRGGILERWARQSLHGVEIVAVEDNLSLPRLLEAGSVDAFVTDSFEVEHFRRGEWPARCEPPLDRKVYWVAPARASELGPRLDRWLSEHETALRQLRREHFGDPAPRDELDHLIDLVARRLDLMPSVAAWKKAHATTVEDPQRERLVLERAAADARRRGLDPSTVTQLFQLQIELAKQVQRRSADGAATLDLDSRLRPALLAIGERILDSLTQVAPIPAADLSFERTLPWSRHLSDVERARLRRALLAVEHAKRLRASEPARR